MYEFKHGHIKWFRSDGVGYIIPIDDPDNSILVDRSSIKHKNSKEMSLDKGQPVKYKSKKILGKEVAVDVQPL